MLVRGKANSSLVGRDPNLAPSVGKRSPKARLRISRFSITNPFFGYPVDESQVVGAFSSRNSIWS